MMKYLRLIKILGLSVFISLICAACNKDTLPQPHLSYANEGLVYEATFQYKTYYVSGLLVLKHEKEGYRVVLLSKIGPTLMDVMITDHDVVWNKLVSALDNPIILRAIENDFRAILLTPMDNPIKVKAMPDNQYKIRKEIKLKIALDDEGKVKSAETRRFLNLFKSFVTYYYTNDDRVPDEICMVHRNLKLKIELKQLAQ